MEKFFENNLKKATPQEMGINTSKVFSGESELKPSREAYNETPIIFSEEIKKRLSPDKEYILADIGSFKGELINKILELSPEYKFNTVAVDINEEALKQNNLGTKLVANADNLPFKDKSIDIEIVRFLLQWNSWEKQKEIIKEIARTVKEFALIQHGGADNNNPKDWRFKMDQLLSGDVVLKLKRGEHFFSSRDEMEKMMKEEGIKFERTQEKVIDDIATIYSERYGLDKEEDKKARDILGDKNFFIQTNWIIYSKDDKDDK